MKKTTIAVGLLTLLFLAVPPAAADNIVLQDWFFNINGNSNFNPNVPPFNFAGFDFATGLGTITGTYNPGPGTYQLIFYVDHDIVGLNNVVENEVGATSGVPGAGQIWEIDDPGYFNDLGCTPTTIGLVDDVVNGTLTNSAWPSTCGPPGDVSMALGWMFTLGAGESATLTWVVSTNAPASGFYLGQTDPLSGQNIFFSNSLNITGGATPVPEPASVVLVAFGLGIAAARRWYHR